MSKSQSLMDATFDAIRDGLERLRKAKRRPEVFGSDSHGFFLGPPLSESEVRKFEEEHQIRLPNDYRRFLTTIGNGGAGPFYGLFVLGEMDDSSEFQKWNENDGFVGSLSKPFPHTAAWNDLDLQPSEMDDEEEYEKAMDGFDHHYWNPNHVNGAIPLCHEGCALRDWLVVTGSETGNMWHDARADYGGMLPVSVSKKSRVTFLQWYCNWLDEAVEELQGIES